MNAIDHAENVIAEQRETISELQRKLAVAERQLDWLDKNCAFVADFKYSLKIYKTGELRQMANSGINQEALKQRRGEK